MTVGAIGLFVAGLVTAGALSALWSAAVALVALAQWGAGLAFGRPAVSPFAALAVALRRSAALLRATLSALFRPSGGAVVAPPVLAPVRGLEAFAREVAEAANTPGFDRVLLVPEANFGAIDAQTPEGRMTILVAGAPLLFVLTVDELRSVIAHELGHLRSAHRRWLRVLGRWTDHVADLAAQTPTPRDPLDWYLRWSASVLGALTAAGSRTEELAADRFAAALVGPAALASALRRVHDDSAGVAAMMDVVYARTKETGVGPDSWTEASVRMYEALPATEKHELVSGGRDDPFDLDGRAHPSFEARIAALGHVIGEGGGDRTPALSALPDVVHSERFLTALVLDAAERRAAKTWVEEYAPVGVRFER